MSSWRSYPSIYNLGHSAVADLFTEPVAIQEKVDGSQFSFGLIEGELRFRSKGQQIQAASPEKMFAPAVESVQSIAANLLPEATYRGEFLSKPKHNSLKYDRVPVGNIIIFDINTAEEAYMDYHQLQAEAERIGLEAVPLFSIGSGIYGQDTIRQLLEAESVLGGTKIEGIVIKSLSLFGKDKKRLMGKFVSEAFKEVHGKEWKASNPSGTDIIQQLVDRYKVEARWQKGVQHLKESGRLEGSPRDIGNLLAEVKRDLIAECSDDMKEKLYRWAADKVVRGACAGLAEWYKDQLLAQQVFE